MCITGIIVLLLFAGAALLFARKSSREFLNLYKIEISRVEHELRDNAVGGALDVGDNAGGTADDGDAAPIDLSGYETITGVYPYFAEDGEDFYGSNNNYHIVDIDGQLYLIEYVIDLSKERKNIYRASLIIIAVTFAALILFLVYIYMSIIRTFNKISDYPAQLSKGNLSIPLSEERNKYFGQFLWGLDMLREKLEDEKRKNLDLQKEKNVFLLSLSHDMKTPVSAIKLYAAALKKNLYKDEDKLRDVGEKIDDNAEEIEKYVSKIISSSGDDFLDLTVHGGEFYLADAIGYVKEYYLDKLKPLGTEFTIGDYSNVLVRGDKDRFIEVLQNILENAIKYGDGNYIRISFDDEEDARLITITNSGDALPGSEAEHIFESFYRGSNVGSKPGSGLGLYISKKLMEKMGGEIFLTTSENEMSITLVLHKVG